MNDWKLFADQSKFFWQFQQLILLVETAVFSGWYKIRADHHSDAFQLQVGILIIGIIVLFVLYLIIKRASQYLDILRPKDIEPKPPLFGIKSSLIGILIPTLLILFNLCLCFYTIQTKGLIHN